MSAVDARINYEGMEEGAEQLDKLVRALAQLVAAEDRAASSTAKLEEELRDEAKATREAEEATKKKTAAMAATTISADAAGQKIGQVGGAMGALGGVLGRVSPQMGALGGALGAVGTAASAATGAIGPLGLAVAAVTTAVTIGTQVFEAYRAEAARAKEEVDSLRESLVQLRAEQDRQSGEMRALSGLVSTADFRAARSDTDRDIANLDREIARRQAIIDRSTRVLRQTRGIASEELSRAFEAQQTAMRGVEDAESAIERVGLRTLEVERDALVERQRSLESVESINRAYNETLGTLEQIAVAQSAFARLGGGVPDDFAESARRLRQQHDRERPTRRARRPANDNGVSEEGKALLEAARLQEEAAEREQLSKQQLVDLERERLDLLEAIALKNSEITERELEAAMELAEQRKEAAQALAEKEDELAQKRLADAREITGRIEGTLQQVASAYIDAFGQAIEGQKTLEAAALDATKALLKSIGEEMVALGIKETLEGFANIVANPPVAATKIPMGIALIAAGAGLGAAGAAIPSQPAAPAERPRGDTDRGGAEGGQTIIINNNQPVISAGTDTQLARRMVRQIDRGRGIGSTRRAAA